MSEKKIVSFFRFAVTRAVCVPVNIELYNWGWQEFGQFGRQLGEELVLFGQFDLCASKLYKPDGDDDHGEQNDQPAEIVMESAHENHCIFRRHNDGEDVHGIGEILGPELDKT
jgi:hypothetical protein